MKVIIISVFIFFGVAQVLGGNIYDEKEEVKEAIEERFKNFISVFEKTLDTIRNEKEKDSSKEKENAEKEGENQKNKAIKTLEEQKHAAARTAIAKGKPLDSFSCIERTVLEGNEQIEATSESYKKTVDNVLPNKVFTLEFLTNQVNSIKVAAEELKDESLKKLQNAISGFQSLKNDAFMKIGTAEKRLQEIEALVTKLNLPDTYTKLKRGIESKYKEVLDILSKKFTKCVA